MKTAFRRIRSTGLPWLILLGLGLGAAARAQEAAQTAPQVLHYQGRFEDVSGAPLPGPVDLVFRVFDVPSGGEALWSELHAGIALNGGSASVLLGSITIFPEGAFSGPARYLELQVDGALLEPRLVVASVPFALEADRLDGFDADDFETAGTAAAAVEALGTTDGSGPNEGENRLHWDQLTGVPEAFADGTDDVFTGGLGELTGADIRDSTLTGADIAPRSVTGDRLAARTVTGVEVALETITGDNLLDDSVRGADLLDGSVTGADLRDGSVSSADLAPGAVTTDAIADGTIQASDLGFDVGDVTAVFAGPGLYGGGEGQIVTLSVGAGTGIQVVGSSVALTPSYESGSAYDSRFLAQAWLQSPSWNPQTGAVSVPGTVFRPATPDGLYTIIPGEGYLYIDAAGNAGAEDEFLAPLQLPHGGSITGFRVTYWDNTLANLEVNLWRARQDGSTRSKVATVITDTQATEWSTGADLTITEPAIDNFEFIYWLEADFPLTPQGSLLRLLSVRVEYTVTRPR